LLASHSSFRCWLCCYICHGSLPAPPPTHDTHTQ
jgi:hypothetical protein